MFPVAIPKSLASKAALILTTGLILLGQMPLLGQGNPDRERLEQDLQLTDRLLRESKSKREKSQADLQLLGEQIRLREQLVTTLEEDIYTLEAEILELDDMICSMEQDMVQIKQKYIETARKVYKSYRPNDFWFSLLSSGSLTDAYYRVVYFREFTKYRVKQLELLERSKAFLIEKSNQVKTSLMEKERLLSTKARESDRLEKSRRNQQSLYKQLEKDASGYQKKMAVNQKQIKGVIQETEELPIVPARAPEPRRLASFRDSRGRLPWPIQQGQGIVIGKFGKTEDAFGNRVSNDGIYIRAPHGQSVHCVFPGQVTGIQSLPIGGKIVIIGHGDYRTVYANLGTCLVKVGDQVNANQSLGTVRSDPRTGETVLNFLVYKMPSTFLNPERWMKGR